MLNNMKSRRGRPRVKKSEQRINLTLTVSQKTKDALDAEVLRTGLNRGRVVEQFFKTQVVV